MTKKFRYNRLIILLRILLLISYCFISFACLTYIVTNNYQFTIKPTINLFLLVFVMFSIRRLLRLIFQESLDINISKNEIIVKNIITRKEFTLNKSEIKGCRIEKFKWNFYKIWGIKPFHEFNSSMIVFYSNLQSLLTLKSYNYFSFKKIWLSLIENDYTFLYRHQKLNNLHKYRLKN